jgi:hypothetical protein
LAHVTKKKSTTTKFQEEIIHIDNKIPNLNTSLKNSHGHIFCTQFKYGKQNVLLSANCVVELPYTKRCKNVVGY